MHYTAPQIKKSIVAGVGFVLTIVAAALEGHLIPDAWLPYVVAAIGVASSYGVFAAKNAPARHAKILPVPDAGDTV